MYVMDVLTLGIHDSTKWVENENLVHQCALKVLLNAKEREEKLKCSENYTDITAHKTSIHRINKRKGL